MRRKVVISGLLLILGILGLAAAKGGPDGVREPGRGTEKDVSKPNETRTDLVWRNGKYHKVTVPIYRYRITESDGRQGEKIVVGGRPGTSEASDRAAVEAQLPPFDPALATVRPSPEDEAAADRELGIDMPPPRPPNPRP